MEQKNEKSEYSIIRSFMSLIQKKNKHLRSMKLRRVIGKDKIIPKKLAKVIFKKCFEALSWLQGEIGSSIR